MRREKLQITALPAWCKLNDVSFLDVKLDDMGTKGYGLCTERALSRADDTYDVPSLLLIPHDLTLSRQAVEEHAKVDQHFKQLLDVAGGKSLRNDVLLFLLMQITIASKEHGQDVGLSNPWTEYVKMLPDDVPVPTRWTEEERLLLVGTSLELALDAKMNSLVREYETLRELTINVPWCHKCWWENNTLDITDWSLLDAWFRSRSLEIPELGEAMVSCLDMVNHSTEPNAYYEPSAKGEVNLLLRPGVKVDKGSEITISYGTSKSAAEMLFSYGFMDSNGVTNSLALTIEPLAADPFGKAKVAAFRGPPVVRIFAKDENIEWESPFLYLLCLNEEDGLDFGVLQENDGTTELRVFWQEQDVTESTDTFGLLIESHALRDVFKLRALAILWDRIQQQLERLYGSEDTMETLTNVAHIDGERQKTAAQLRKEETSMLEAAYSTVELQKAILLESEVVVRYLGSMENENEPEVGQSKTNEDEDFS